MNVGATGKRPQKTPVGDLRPSQMLYTYGVGAIVDLPRIAAMVMGLDDWDVNYCREITEERLLTAVQTVLGNQVSALRTPPVPTETGDHGAFNDNARIGVPVAPFPRWLVCPYCHLLAPIGASMIELRPNQYRPERTCYVHINCTKPGRPPEMLPVRFLTACKNGHLDDFPWMWFVHQGPTACKGALRLKDLGASGEAADVEIKCDACGLSRRMSDAFGEEGKKNLPPLCKGRLPHLRDYDSKTCEEPIRSILLGASNCWFPLTLSALYIPKATDKIGKLIETHWATLDKIVDLNQVTLLRSLNILNAFVDYSDDEVWKAIEQQRVPPADDGDDVKDLKTPEWNVFAKPDASLNGTDFMLSVVTAPHGYESLFTEVVLVERIREVNALVGFTRIESPGDFADIDEISETRRVALARKAPTWVPASEVRGEGIFFKFNEQALYAWTSKAEVRAREKVFLDAHSRWRDIRHLSPPSHHFPGIGYVLLHSFAHAVMRQLTLECGYTAASIRERIYWRAQEIGSEPMAGVLIYTAAPDSEGTLGGLVGLGEPQTLGRHISQALEMVRLCASDPLCAEHHPYRDGITLHGASCHACLFAPETSCERSNKYLDRSLLVATVERADLSFFPEPE
jgi:hypothetical protein